MTSTSLEYIAATADEAIHKGLTELNVTREEVDIEVLENGSKGFFGFGAKQARVRMTIKADSLRASIQKDDEESTVPEPAPVEKPAPAPKKEAAAESPKPAPKPAQKKEPKQAPAQKPAPVQKPAPAPKPEAAPVMIEPDADGAGMDEASDEVVNEETLNIAANVVRDLLEKMRVKATIQSRIGEAADEVDSRVIMIDIQGDDLSFLIGRHSEVLHSLQYITSLIVGREVGHWVPLIIDVQGYRERRERQLRQMAVRMAEQVVKTGRRISLEPMSATERRIIHLALRDNHQITTESIGEEPNRKVVIYPKDRK